MATRLATARNFITVTSVASSDDSEINSSISSSTTTNTTSDVQRTTQITPVSLHHVNLSQKKIILQTAPSGSVSVIDVVPLESSDSSDSQILVAESNGLNQNSQQVTAQVAVVQAQGSPNGQHFIAVSGKLTDGVQKLQYAPLTTVVSTQDGSYVQYVDSDLYTSSTGQESSQMSYPVYAVGSSGIDYTSGQQYYANATSSFASSSSSSNGNTNNNSYIVPVEDAILTQSRGSPQTISSNDVTFIQGQGASNSSSSSNTSTGGPPQSQNDIGKLNMDSSEATPNLTHATRVSPATVAWLVENYETAEGVSLPRSTLYNHYMRHCNEHKLDAVNAASFGKLIRSVFTGLRTRRLGTRGNSKYHYYGIRIKPGSNLVNVVVDEKTSSTPNQYNSGSGSSGHVGSRKKFKPNPESFETCAQFLGDHISAIPDFSPLEIPHALPDDVTLEDVDTLRSIYREHLEAFLDAVLNLEFNTIESLWREFWRAHDNNNMDECEEEKYLSKQKLFKLCQIEAVQKFLKQIDFQFYQNMVDVLIPDVLRPIPSTLTQSIRNFAKNLENWLTSAMIGCPEEIIQIKLSAVSAFSQTLRRYTSLNHLAQAARAVLHNTTQISQMLSDLNRVDFHNVQEQASWVCQCDPAIVQRLESEFKSALQQQNTLEQWAAWLRLVVDQALEEHRGKPSYVKAARQFLLKWSFYSSMVIRDLTLRSAASFGSFHLIRLLYDEYMFFILERKVAENTQTQPIAVMNARISDESFSIRPNLCFNDFDVKVEPSKVHRQ